MTTTTETVAPEVRDRFQRAFLAALVVEPWRPDELPVAIEFGIFSPKKYRGWRGRKPSASTWQLGFKKGMSVVLQGTEDWWLFAGEGALIARWCKVSIPLCLRLDAICDAAWAAGIRSAKVTFEGSCGMSAHEILALQAEADKWPSSPAKNKWPSAPARDEP